MTLHTSITLHGRSSNAPLGTPPHAPSWEHFAHQADIGVRGYGHCPEEAFNQTALALIAVITDPRCIEPHETLTLECRAPDLELLLVDWLNALIYEIATRHLLFCAFDVSINGHHLHATAWGETIDPGTASTGSRSKRRDLNGIACRSHRRGSLDGPMRRRCLMRRYGPGTARTTQPR